MTKGLLICGVASSLLYIAMNIFVPRMYPGYDWRSMTVSELSAIGTPTRTLWVWLGVAYTLLFILFAWGVIRSAVDNQKLKWSGYALLAYGIVSIVWPWAPMHQREVLAMGGKTVSDTLHLSLAGTTVLLMTVSMILGAIAFDVKFRNYTALTLLVLLVFGALTGIESPKVEANLPTQWIGVWERINILVFLIWVVVLAVKLMRKETSL